MAAFPKKYLIVVCGPTASGKTALAIQLAQYFNTEILSCDSRQFYREMSIGTAKPDLEELAAVKHHFINNLSIYDAYNAGDYEAEALKLLDKLYEKNNVVIMAGGTGMYIKAVCEGLDDFPEVPEEVKNALQQVFELKGIEALQEELKEKDLNYYKKVDLNNPHRLIRALGICRASGRPYSTFLNAPKAQRYFDSIYIQIDWEREALYDRINRRVDIMMKGGLLDEVKSLLKDQHLNALQTVGYQELFDYLNGRTNLDKAILNIKQNTRRYAKRQITWFKKIPGMRSFQPDQLHKIIPWLENQIN